MKNLLSLAAAAAAAAATMYYFDPDSGARRRAKLLALASGGRLDNRYPAWSTRHPQDDAQLREAVLARVSRLVSHPQCVQVEAEEGCVRLSGDVLQQELDGLLIRVRDMAGVRRVVNALTPWDNPADLARKEADSALASEDLARAHPT
ncbi:MAG TPA: BON domain-containing protein [Ramlibacter sp.]|uniref:BON domain-containing protein n=1 Tax=Ramlibacter sp. TaxID=1917967 RepID=UPI002C6D0AAE|nr:BON domain-containing protein [Ramlibacter sp.]HVZ45974.1 BON domain-containing protein [Ramlibacter sp.]